MISLLRRPTIVALIGLVLIIAVADVSDRWSISYPLVRSDDGDSANPAALWSLEIGRFLVALAVVGVGAVVVYRPASIVVSMLYVIVGAIGSSARPALLLSHGNLSFPSALVLWAASTNLLKEFAFSSLLAIGILALLRRYMPRT